MLSRTGEERARCGLSRVDERSAQDGREPCQQRHRCTGGERQHCAGAGRGQDDPVEDTPLRGVGQRGDGECLAERNEARERRLSSDHGRLRLKSAVQGLVNPLTGVDNDLVKRAAFTLAAMVVLTTVTAMSSADAAVSHPTAGAKVCSLLEIAVKPNAWIARNCSNCPKTVCHATPTKGDTTSSQTKLLFLISARADAVTMTGIPAAKFYSTSDVQGAGSFTVDAHEPTIIAAVGTIHVKHEYISDQVPDITLTLKVKDGGSIRRNSANGGIAIITPVTVSASSLKTCIGHAGTVALTDVPKVPATVSIAVCGSTIALVDGKGPKGADPTNDVQVNIE